MKHKGVPLLVLIAGVMISAAAAQDSLTLEDAVARALEFNISVRRQTLALSTATRTRDTAWNVLIPSLSAQAGTSKSNPTAADWTLTGTLGASLTLSPALIDSIKAKQLAFEAGTISLDQVKREIERSVRKLWYQLLTANEQVSVLEASWSNTTLSLEQTRTKQASGLASEIDLLNARIKAEDARLKVENARTLCSQNLAGFRQLIGLPAESTSNFAFGTLDVPESLSSPDIDHLTSDTIRALLTNIESTRTARALSYKQNFLPSLNLSWNWAPTTSSADFSEWNDRGSFSASLGMKLDPFLPDSAARTALSNAEDTVSDLELQLQNAQESLKLEVIKLLDSLESNQAALAAYQANLALAERSWELTQEAYRRGTRDLLSLQSTEQALREARLQLINQNRTILETIVDLEYSCGLPFGSLGGTK
ncbi:MAG: hypothetical protein A3J97_16695 [Spirochaetes bacterium RIFOXYC1_FULL_54_7]|nr:MAG: hypothetical protein A3J97_16695 [Spirochaetes bacterium RIFOXYC1_FULL_54_7]